MSKFPTNPQKLPWPTDRGGMTQKLQREGCRAIGRMMGDDDAYEVLMEVLRVLAKHADAMLEQQKADKQARIDALYGMREKAVKDKQADEALQVKVIDANIKKFQERKAAIEAGQPVAPEAPVAPVAPVAEPVVEPAAVVGPQQPVAP